MALQISFYDIQRKFRRKSVVLFALISGYYILSFLLIGSVLKIISHKNFVGLNAGEVAVIIILCITATFFQIKYAIKNGIRILKQSIADLMYSRGK